MDEATEDIEIVSSGEWFKKLMKINQRKRQNNKIFAANKRTRTNKYKKRHI